MYRKLHLRPQLSAFPWRVALCLILVALFLYNPFLTIYGASPIANIQHPPSYRATVAGTELQSCTVEPARPLAPTLEAAVVHAWIQAAATSPVLHALPDNTFRPMPHVICNSLWFRPPPIS
jgi:hypothetical protein